MAKRSSIEIKASLQKERQALYSKRSRLIAERKRLGLTNSTEKQRQKVDKQIDTASKRIQTKSTKLFKYTDQYKKITQTRRNLQSSVKYFVKQLDNKSLSPAERLEIMRKIRKRTNEIKGLYELQGRKIVIRKNKPEFAQDEKKIVSFFVVPFWEAKPIFETLYNPEKYKTLDLEGDITSMDSQLAFLVDVDQYLIKVEAERFNADPSYHISITADLNTGVIGAVRT